MTRILSLGIAILFLGAAVAYPYKEEDDNDLEEFQPEYNQDQVASIYSII